MEGGPERGRGAEGAGNERRSVVATHQTRKIKMPEGRERGEREGGRGLGVGRDATKQGKSRLVGARRGRGQAGNKRAQGLGVVGGGGGFTLVYRQCTVAQTRLPPPSPPAAGPNDLPMSFPVISRQEGPCWLPQLLKFPCLPFTMHPNIHQRIFRTRPKIIGESFREGASHTPSPCWLL